MGRFYLEGLRPGIKGTSYAAWRECSQLSRRGALDDRVAAAAVGVKRNETAL